MQELKTVEKGTRQDRPISIESRVAIIVSERRPSLGTGYSVQGCSLPFTRLFSRPPRPCWTISYILIAELTVYDMQLEPTCRPLDEITVFQLSKLLTWRRYTHPYTDVIAIVVTISLRSWVTYDPRIMAINLINIMPKPRHLKERDHPHPHPRISTDIWLLRLLQVIRLQTITRSGFPQGIHVPSPEPV